jgi:hypothetical protein
MPKSSSLLMHGFWITKSWFNLIGYLIQEENLWLMLSKCVDLKTNAVYKTQMAQISTLKTQIIYCDIYEKIIRLSKHKLHKY